MASNLEDHHHHGLALWRHEVHRAFGHQSLLVSAGHGLKLYSGGWTREFKPITFLPVRYEGARPTILAKARNTKISTFLKFNINLTQH